jgi:hypothetical protein
MRNLTLAFVAAFLSLFATPAAAGPTLLVNSSGQLTGATGVDVNGTLYDVTFVDGTCNSVFGGCANFVFDENGAFAAANSLVALFAGAPTFNSTADLVSGCDGPATTSFAGTSYCEMFVPFSANAGLVAVIDAYNFSGNGSDQVVNGSLLFDANYDTTYQAAWQADDLVWAVFTPASASLPEPSTWALMLLGFFGIGIAARRKRMADRLPQLAVSVFHPLRTLQHRENL